MYEINLKWGSYVIRFQFLFLTAIIIYLENAAIGISGYYMHMCCGGLNPFSLNQLAS